MSQSFWSNFTGRYSVISNNYSNELIPTCLGNLSNCVIAGDENGNVYVWRDVESIKEHIGINLSGHSSAVQRIILSDDDKRFVSMGRSD